MGELPVTFAGRTLLLRYGCETAGIFLELLFGDLRCTALSSPPDALLEVVKRTDPDRRRWALIDNGRHYTDGTLGVSFAAILFDRAIFHLLADNGGGVALHAGAVTHDRQIIFIPGQSGAGKSTLAAWLTSRGFSYLTDELVFLPTKGSVAHYFTRPFNIKPGSREVVRGLRNFADTSGLIGDDHGAIVPHRALNPHFLPETCQPGLLLFPSYRAGADLRVERLSQARAGMAMVSCNVNGRNLADHGFGQLMKVARSTPAYRLTYSSFDGLDEELTALLRRHRP